MTESELQFQETGSITIQMPEYKWSFELVPDVPGTIVVNLPKRPNLWYRFWTRVFFGWKFEKVE